MLRVILLIVVALMQAMLLHVVWCALCTWFGEVEFPAWVEVGDLILERPGSISAALALYGVPVGVAIATVVFIAPMAPARRLSEHGRSLRSSVIAAAFIGGGLTLGLAFVLLDLPQRATRKGVEFFSTEWEFLVAVVVVLAVSWALWTLLLWRYAHRTDGSTASRLLKIILGGSIIELSIAIPAYAYMRSKESCWCGLGTFWALACGLAGLFFVTGPGALLLWYHRTHRWVGRFDRHCAKCGYPRAPGGGSVCPECGGAWIKTPLPSDTRRNERATDGI